MINISEMRIDASTFEGENVRGELRIESDDHARIRGMVFSDSGRIVTDIDRFEGRDVRIRYGVDIRDLQAGTTLTGTITIAAEGGEYSIPCTVRIREALMKSEFGNIRSLNEFVQLARTDYEEAFRMFRSDAFAALLKGKDAIYEALYRGSRQSCHDAEDGRVPDPCGKKGEGRSQAAFSVPGALRPEHAGGRDGNHKTERLGSPEFGAQKRRRLSLSSENQAFRGRLCRIRRRSSLPDSDGSDRQRCPYGHDRTGV